MSATNQSLIQKADIAVADLAAGGLLDAEQSATFTRKLFAQPTFLRQARQVTMNSPQMKINKISMGQRVLHPAQSQVALTVAQRSKPTTEQILLNTQEYIAEVRIPYDVIEDNIEGGNIGRRTDNSLGPTTGGLKDTIMDLLLERVGVDLEQLALLGNTASADPYLATKDGFLTQATANQVDAGGAQISKAIFKDGLKAMPDEYLQDRNALRAFVSTDQEIEYRDTLADRETVLGDGQIVRGGPVFAYGMRVEGVSRMPSTTGLICDPRGLIFGIQRAIHVETDKNITERVYIIVLTLRVDIKMEEVDAAVLIENIAP